MPDRPIVHIATTAPSGTNLANFTNDAAFVSAKGSAAAEGDQYFRTTAPIGHRYFADAAWRTAASLDQTQTLTNKTLTTPILTVPIVNGVKMPVTVPAVANYTVLTSDFTIAADAGTTTTVTLPAASGNAQTMYLVKKTDTSTTSISVTDGGFSTTLHTQGESIFVQSNGTTYLVLQRAIPSIWTSYSPAEGSWLTAANAAYTGMWRRVGDSIELQIRVTLSGAPTSAALTFSVPSFAAVDEAKLLSTGAGALLAASIDILSAGTQYVGGVVNYNGTVFRVQNINSNIGVAANVTEAVPNTFASGDFVEVKFSYPVTNWNA